MVNKYESSHYILPDQHLHKKRTDLHVVKIYLYTLFDEGKTHLAYIKTILPCGPR